MTELKRSHEILKANLRSDLAKACVACGMPLQKKIKNKIFAVPNLSRIRIAERSQYVSYRILTSLALLTECSFIFIVWHECGKISCIIKPLKAKYFKTISATECISLYWLDTELNGRFYYFQNLMLKKLKRKMACSKNSDMFFKPLIVKDKNYISITKNYISKLKYLVLLC